MRRKTIFLFNGPPGCGKDAACAEIMRLDPETIYAYYKEWLYEETAGLLDFTFEAWSKICQDTELKDTPMFLQFEGKAATPRQILIHFAETLIKPKHGRDCIAVKMAERLREKVKGLDHYTVVVPDVGFPEELTLIQENFPDANIVLVHIKRPGCSYVNDSRTYVGEPNVVLDNSGSFESFKKAVFDLYLQEKTYPFED